MTTSQAAPSNRDVPGPDGTPPGAPGSAALLTLHWVSAHRIQPHRRLGVLAGTVGLVAEGASDEIRFALALWGLSTGTFLVLDAVMLRRLTRSGAGDRP